MTFTKLQWLKGINSIKSRSSDKLIKYLLINNDYTLQALND